MVVMRAEALRVLVFDKQRPLAEVWCDVTDLGCDYSAALHCTLPTAWLLGEPVPFDRFPDW
jgi:hypothetical protein